MVFKRRDRRGWLASLKEMFYPTGGFRRATRYVVHRMRRLPDRPERIARGVFAGSLIGFLPLPGLQFLGAAGLAWLMRGNIFAALLATFNSNPITTPIFAVAAISLGHWITGVSMPLSAEGIGAAFASAGQDLWTNAKALFQGGEMHWAGLIEFWHNVYVPYFIGALLPGIGLSAVFYYITIPLVAAYQKARAAKFHERSERRQLLRQKLGLQMPEAGKSASKEGDDAAPPKA